MTFEALKEIIVATVSTGGDKTAMDARQIPDVCADSLDAVDLAMAI